MSQQQSQRRTSFYHRLRLISCSQDSYNDHYSVSSDDCHSQQQDQRSHRPNRYQGYKDSNISVTPPIKCPSPSQEDSSFDRDDIGKAIIESHYNHRSWVMYDRIVHSREEQLRQFMNSGIMNTGNRMTTKSPALMQSVFGPDIHSIGDNPSRHSEEDKHTIIVKDSINDYEMIFNMEM